MSTTHASKEPTSAPSVNRWLAVFGIVVVTGILAGFYGVNEYASGTAAIVKNANSNAGRFESIFRDLVQARFRALNIAAETMLQSKVTTDAFAKEDRASLIARTEPFFERLKRDHGIEQLNFWQPPAKVFYRAGKASEFGMDLSNLRKSIVAANERRQAILAIETGAGGNIALRAIRPVVVDEKFVGVFEFVSNFNIPLERASETSGLKWAVSLNKETSERVERPANPKLDAWHGNDVYYVFSDPATGDTVRAIPFDARAKDHSLANQDGRTIFVKTFPVVNFSGIPTITVATVLDVTQPFADVMRTTTIKSMILFLLLAIAGSVAYIKFGDIKAQFGGALGRNKLELESRIASCDAAHAKLKEVDVIKRGFFTNLVTAVNEPLQAVAGQLKSLPASLAAAGVSTEVKERVEFALSETTRLSRLVEDYQQIEMFRQKLVRADCPAVSLSAVIAKTLDEDLAIYRRLPQLSMSMAIATDLPPTRADGDLLQRAFAALAGFAAQGVGQGQIKISGTVDDAKWLVVAITGSAFTGAGATSEALLDESCQFLARLANGAAPAADGGSMVSVVLARVILEFYGGSLSVSTTAGAPGFIVRLPAAA